MICPHCGAGIPVNSNFCTYCGAALVPQEGGAPEHRQDAEDLAFDFMNHPAHAPPQRFKLDLGKLLGDTFELYKRHFETFCLVGLLLFGVPFVISLIGEILQRAAVAMGVGGHPEWFWADAEERPALFLFLVIGIALSIFTQALQFLVQCYFALGTMRQGLYLARGGSGFQASQMFPPLMPFLKIIGLYLLIACIFVPLVLLFVVPVFVAVGVTSAGAAANEPHAVGIIVAAVLLYLVGTCVIIWLWIRLHLAQFFLADRDTGIVDSMGIGWDVSRGNFWILLLAVFVLSILAGLGVFLCCIGLVMTVALSWLGGVLAYMQLTGEPNCLDYMPSFLEQPFEQPLQLEEGGSQELEVRS